MAGPTPTMRFDFGSARLAIAVLSCVGSASGAVITDPSQIGPGAVLVDFEQFPVGAIGSPLVLPGIAFSAGPGLGIVSVAGFPANGTAVQSRTLQPVPSGGFVGDYTTLTMSFDAPVSQIVFGWFDANFAGNVARALGSSGELLEAGAVALGPAGGCCAAWIGFARPSADIWSIEVVPAATNDVYSIDNVLFLVGAPPSSCPADLTGDGTVDGADLGVLLAAWGGGGPADLDGSGAVDGADLGELLASWGPCVG